MRTRPRSRAGFTLVELMTVVAIVAVMATIAIISLRSNRSSNDADAWANNVRNTVNFVRRRASATQTPYMIELTSTTMTWCQLSAANCAGGGTTCSATTNCTGINTTCEKGRTVTAGSDALTASWAAQADETMAVSGVASNFVAPTPTTISGTKQLFFGPYGSTDATCANVLVSPTGALNGFTVYVRAANNVPSATAQTQKRRKVAIYGPTGRPRIIDSW